MLANYNVANVLRMQYVNWNEKIEQYKQRFGFTSDAQVASDLGITRGALNNFTRGHAPWPTALKIAILDRLGYAVTRNVLLGLVPQREAAHFLELDHARARKRIERAKDARLAATRAALRELYCSFSLDEMEEIVGEIIDEMREENTGNQ